uniref:Uncharacterized protein n=1 Tax=Glossina morsitans morsitans TaxID=37546 RepID=A0A1B0FRL2_GLOMM
MRRNLRLDWRALALLGALLSIIIDWPGLVYAMPILLPSSSSSSSSSASTTIASTPIAAYTENINVINVTKYVSSAAGAMSVKNSNKNNNNNNNTSEQDIRYNATMDIAGSFSLLKKQRKILYLNENNMNHLLNNRHLTTNEKQEVNDKITHSISKHNINKNNNNNNDNNDNNNHSGTAICAGQTYKYTNHPRINATENFHQLIEEIPISHMATTTESNIFTTDIYSDIAIDTESTAVNEDEDNDNDNDNDNEKNSSLFAAAFQFSSSNHLAILSRTERSISSLSSSHSFQRSPDSVSSSSSSSRSSSSSSGSSRGVRSSSSSGSSGSGIVRRSSDANGVKSKRLNNSRTQHNNNNKNNLDRNERSTLSHLSGPSRKIQLYIKNRFIQLMPDGTVNGTQDDQSEYISHFSE